MHSDDVTPEKFHSCPTESGGAGHCLYPQYCVTSAFYNFDKFVKHSCIIREKFVGFCCPDREENEHYDLSNDVRALDELPVTTPVSNFSTTLSTDDPSTTGSTTNTIKTVEEETEVTTTVDSKKHEDENVWNSPVSSDCGRFDYSLRSRIYGGKDSSPGSWPWVVSPTDHHCNYPNLLDSQQAALVKKSDGIAFCGGALMTRRGHVLTAAHCLAGYNLFSPILHVNLNHHPD